MQWALPSHPLDLIADLPLIQQFELMVEYAMRKYEAHAQRLPIPKGLTFGPRRMLK